MNQTREQLKKTIKNFTDNIYFQVPLEEYLSLCHYLEANPLKTFYEGKNDLELRRILMIRDIPYVWITKEGELYDVEYFQP